MISMSIDDNKKENRIKKDKKREKKKCNKIYEKNIKNVENKKVENKNVENKKVENNISIYESLKENWRSWIVLLVSVSILSYPNIYSGIFTIFVAMIWYYLVHRSQHSYDLNIINVIHHYHHSTHNLFSEFIEIILEINFINNFFIFHYFNFFEYLFINQWIIVLFTIMYITIHKINYSELRVNSVHRLHHGDILYNHGPDICDILFGTKHPSEITVENTDHYIPNIIFTTGFLYGIQYLWNKDFNYKCYIKNIGYTILISSFLIFVVISNYLWFFTDFPKKWNDEKKNTENTMI